MNDKTYVRPTPRQLNKADLLGLTSEELLEHVATLRRVDPVTTALANKLRNSRLIIGHIRKLLENMNANNAHDDRFSLDASAVDRCCDCAHYNLPRSECTLLDIDIRTSTVSRCPLHQTLDEPSEPIDKRVVVVCASCYVSYNRNRDGICPKCKTEEVLP